MKNEYAISGDPDHFVASDLGLHGLHCPIKYILWVRPKEIDASL